jgi:hypothetical protein
MIFKINECHVILKSATSSKKNKNEIDFKIWENRGIKIADLKIGVSKFNFFENRGIKTAIKPNFYIDIAKFRNSSISNGVDITQLKSTGGKRKANRIPLSPLNTGNIVIIKLDFALYYTMY